LNCNPPDLTTGAGLRFFCCCFCLVLVVLGFELAVDFFGKFFSYIKSFLCVDSLFFIVNGIKLFYKIIFVHQENIFSYIYI
jgi:hypothetical protein